MYKKGIVLCCALISISLLFSQEKFKLDSSAYAFDSLETSHPSGKIPIAILDLDANNVTQAEARALSDRLRVEVFNAGIFDVMEREKMKSILDEMQFQLSGCTSNECAIEIGRLVGVEKIIAGSVSKVGEFYTVSLRLIDVETGKIKATALEDIEGSLGAVLTRAIPSVAYQISGLDNPYYIEPMTAVSINTEPSNASVYFNNIYQGESPIRIKVEPDKRYGLRVEKEGYQTWENVCENEEGQVLELSIALSRESSEKIGFKEKPKRRFDNGFKIRFIRAGFYDKVNKYIIAVNESIAQHSLLFKEEIPCEVNFPPINSFNGIEFYNIGDADDNSGFDFGIGVYRADFGTWFSDLLNEDVDKDYSLAFWSPQLTLSFRISPINYPLFYPIFNIGFGYNLLFLNAHRENKSLGGPVYHSWGFTYGVGFEIRILKPIGISAEWNRRNMNMELIDIDQITDNFDNNGLGKLNITGNNIGFSINLYY
jgi:hypothetical protein